MTESNYTRRPGLVLHSPVDPHPPVLLPVDQVPLEDVTHAELVKRVRNQREVLGRLRGELAETVGTLREEVAALRAQLNEHEERAASLRDQHSSDGVRIEGLVGELGRVRAELERFQGRVREVAIRVADEQNWCRDGLNDVLDELGLARHVRLFRVPLRVVAIQHITVDVEAEDEDVAEDEVDTQDVADALERAGWEIDDWSVPIGARIREL